MTAQSWTTNPGRRAFNELGHDVRKRWSTATQSQTLTEFSSITPPSTSLPISPSIPIPFSSANASFTTQQPVPSAYSSSSELPSSSQTLSTRTFTTTIPQTSFLPSTTITYSVQTVLSAATPVSLASSGQGVCIGDRLDASADGLLATIVLSSAIGLFLWLLFAILRPRFRQIYSLREWFVQQDLRPKPLKPTLWAFLSPPVPLVPSIPVDVSDAGASPVGDAHLFPSDEQLSQRTLWVCFLLSSGWSILGLAGALPLYLVSTPCIQESASQPRFTGFLSTLQDLSLLRLLQLLDDRDISISNSRTQTRAIVDGNDVASNTRVRIVILTVFVIVLGLIPSLWKILHEFTKLAAFRKRWLNVRLRGLEMGWLSARDAPGFSGWGEKHLKDFITRTGLSSSFDSRPSNDSGRNGHTQRSGVDVPLARAEEEKLDVDIQSLFSIGDTQPLALLIEERDEILENLEIAETKYISSFRLSTPDPSIADFTPAPVSDTEGIPYISRPRALRSTARRRRARNPAYASSSLTPTSYVAPSQYYKLGSLRGVNGGRFADEEEPGPSFSDSIHQRVVGTRFQEVNRNSSLYGRLPMGSRIRLEGGVLSPEPIPVPSPLLPDPRRFGPNYVEPSTDTDGGNPSDLDKYEGEDSERWVDVAHEAPIDFSKDESPPLTEASPVPVHEPSEAGIFNFGRRPKIFGPSPSDRMDTFPLRDRGATSRASEVAPPHLRLQAQPPFVRPVTGLDHDDLGIVYADIRSWRTKLKSINQEIADAQADAYSDIADGVRIKGWLMVGRGLRYIPGMQLIEGRAKEDVRWDELQGESDPLNRLVFWVIVAMIGCLLAIGLTAAAGLAVATAPDYAHYLPFFQPLANHNSFTTGLSTVLAPAVGATLFIAIAIVGLYSMFDHTSLPPGSADATAESARLITTASVSANQLIIFKTAFYLLTIIAVIWLTAAGAILYAFGALSTNTSRAKTISDGAIYISVLLLAIVINVAIVSPALLMLQPLRLRRVLRSEKEAVTPRQRFRAVYPRTYSPLFASSCCVLAVIFASTYSLIFPLMSPAAVVLLLLTLIAHRYLIGYVYARTLSQTGGLLQLWLLKRLGTILALQPLLLGLILLSRQLWAEGAVLVAAAVFTVGFVEAYTFLKMRQPGPSLLSHVTQDSLDTFAKRARPKRNQRLTEESSSFAISGRAARTRGSMASVLEMMSVTLAVMPSTTRTRGPVPLQTETLNDLTATERAARTHPDAPPYLPPLSFADHAEEMSSIMYAPELIAPAPIIWLPNDSAGVARSEAYDLQRYHDLRTTLDVRTKEDVHPRRSSSSRAHRASGR